MVVDLRRVRQLHHLAEVHDRDAVADVAHDQNVVGDEQIGQAHLLLQLAEHVDDLRLNGHVQRGHRLVADDELRVEGERAGDADALALAAGELMGVAGGMLAVEPHAVHQLQNPLMALLLARVHLMYVQRLADDIRDRHARVERGIGVLENHRRLLAVLVDVRPGGDGLAVEQNLAFRGLVEVQQRAADGGFAAAGLAHESKRLALADGKGHVVHRLERLGLEHTDVDGEIFLEVFDLNQGRLVFAHFAAPPFSVSMLPSSTPALTFIQHAA